MFQVPGHRVPSPVPCSGRRLYSETLLIPVWSGCSMTTVRKRKRETLLSLTTWCPGPQRVSCICNKLFWLWHHSGNRSAGHRWGLPRWVPGIAWKLQFNRENHMSERKCLKKESIVVMMRQAYIISNDYQQPLVLFTVITVLWPMCIWWLS